MTSHFEPSFDFAQKLDQEDPLRSFREKFVFPQHHGEPVLYFCGNSLGLQPIAVRDAVNAELDHWGEHAVEGHFRGEKPWMYYHKFLTEATARLVGALPHEVVVMNTLSVNLHLMMVSFYRPSGKRYKIIMEAGAFPSDQYAVESQVRFHGFEPADAIVEVAPREGEETLRTADILETISRHGNETALVLFSGVQYYTGQFFDLKAITEAAHRAGAHAGFDLAHTAGNLPLELHEWGPDFAVWCSYKYLNSGPGGPSGVFVHERHANSPELPRFAGWWGHDEDSRFRMEKGFRPMHGAAGWQLSNAQILSFAAHLASLNLFDEAGMNRLRVKSLLLTAYLEYTLTSARDRGLDFRIITPNESNSRGCQLSLLTGPEGRALFDRLTGQGVVTDWREPNVIRFAPVPFYNSFTDIWKLGKLL
ncbi:MAG: kynureninase [Bacteroidota bacterium]